MTYQDSAPEQHSRRTLLKRAVAGGTLALGFGALDGLVRAAHATDRVSTTVGLGDGGYGELRPVIRTDPVTGYRQELLLPHGFDFALFGLAGTTMDDGHVTPLGHDGMAAYRGPHGSYRLVRNHEERTGSGQVSPSGDAADRYDGSGGGGTSTLQVSVRSGQVEVERVWTSLAGTIVNCAGGPTPWGSWLSCEETTAGTRHAGWERDHGYVFEVDSRADRPVEPKPLPALGRFVHEAVAVDHRTGIVYLTEDRGTAGFYRFVPARRGDLTLGKLQMLAVADAAGYDTRTGQSQGAELPIEWVDIDDPDPRDAETDPLAVYRQGHARGGATFARLEGCWWGGQAVYLVSTNGGDVGEGQIWEYRPHPGGRDGGTLSLVYESFDRAVMSFPDNITVSPRGTLLVCEDTSRSDPQLIGVTGEGSTFPFCVDPTDDEWCGATFSHDGRVLFANLQGSTSGSPLAPETPGRTVAIWGPWQRGAL
nr:alkaline phosphatase PhoX [Haloechinothrix sp. LS1_15]